MVELQILNKIIHDKSDKIIRYNNITDEYFDNYKDEWQFIKEHKEKYNVFPDIETVLDKFPEFEVLNVQDSDDYLVNTFREEYLYRQSLPILEEMANKLQTDSYSALDYLRQHLTELTIPDNVVGVDIISQANDRLEEHKKLSEDTEGCFIGTGFEELDDVTGGWHRGEELGVFFARTGIGKTWVVMKNLEHAWKMNNNIVLVEPEMTATRVGFRFDTLHKHISNYDLLRGNDVVGYEKYIKNLSEHDIPIWVIHPKDLDRKVTVSKLRTQCELKKADMLIIDGISYLTDERKERGDSKTDQLTHISEDLMDLSIELKIPVLVVVQSNREGARDEDLQLENIRDSDGIAFNASVVISVQQKNGQLVLQLLKSRNSSNGVKLNYLWDIDTGMFTYIPSGDDDMYDDDEQAENLRARYNDSSEEY